MPKIKNFQIEVEFKVRNGSYQKNQKRSTADEKDALPVPMKRSMEKQIRYTEMDSLFGWLQIELHQVLFSEVLVSGEF